MQKSIPGLVLVLVTCLATLTPLGAASADPRYAWRPAKSPTETIAERIAPPPGFQRPLVAPGSFAAWLRGLPLRAPGSPVRLYTGAPKPRQDAHFAVVEIDVGARDLQQCADAAMRLRAEWLFASGRARDIAFNATGSGQPIAFARWAGGERPRVSNSSVTWSRSAGADAGYTSFRRYMDTVFAWAGTLSLEREMKSVPLEQMQAGDLFIKGGSPGHAVMVADMVESKATGEKRVLLLQSYMPAQDIHVLRNPRDPDDGPWYPLAFEGHLMTPEWIFPRDSLRRWR